MDEKPIRGEAVRLTAPQRHSLMKELKVKALEGDIQAVLAIGIYEIVESNKKLNDSLNRSGVAA